MVFPIKRRPLEKTRIIDQNNNDNKMGTKDKKTGTNGDCGHETHLSNTECKMVQRVNVLKDFNMTLLPFGYRKQQRK